MTTLPALSPIITIAVAVIVSAYCLWIVGGK